MAKHSSGDFILRIEDTDVKRLVSGATKKIYEILKKFGLDWDEGPNVGGPYEPYIQSQRVKKGIYKRAAEKLVAKGHAFYCRHKARNAKKEGYSKELRDSCRDLGLKEGAIKLKAPDGEKISFTDFVLGKEVSWDTSTVADTTLLKSDGFPTYHLAVVVDDEDMKITHVLRGHDWMPSTPIHLLVYKYLGFDVPKIGHLTDILDPEGGKLSKRKGSTSVERFLKEGYLPEAILNFIMLLGWAPKDNRELFTLEEFVKVFDPSGFQKSNPVFNKEKLKWFNNHYYQKLQQESPSGFTQFISTASGYSNEPHFSDIVSGTAPLTAPRASDISEYDSYIRPFYESPKNIVSLLGPNYKEHLRVAYNALSSLKEWRKERVDSVLLGAVKENNFNTGDFFMDLRIALTGNRSTLPTGDFISYYAKVFDKNDILERIKKVI